MPPTWMGVDGSTGEEEPETSEDDPKDPTATYELPEPSPELKAIAKADALFAGMSRAEVLAAVPTLYFDGDHEPGLRQPFRLVRDDDDVLEPAAPVREVDTLSEEDRERGERIVDEVLSELNQRREDGVLSLSRERYLRLRRRKGLPTPD